MEFAEKLTEILRFVEEINKKLEDLQTKCDANHKEIFDELSMLTKAVARIDMLIS